MSDIIDWLIYFWCGFCLTLLMVMLSIAVLWEVKSVIGWAINGIGG